MKGFAAMTLGGLVVVLLSAIAPDTARWYALGLLVAFVFVASALPRRRVQAGAEDPASPPSRAEASGSQ